MEDDDVGPPQARVFFLFFCLFSFPRMLVPPVFVGFAFFG